MTDVSAAVAGLYGKVPSKADFVHRNLPAAFVRPWDEWLSRCLGASRGALGGRWTEAYLSGPVWRFALEPGLLGPGGWGGVLATSVDAVNRFFPLTIAIPLGGDVSVATAGERLQSWLPQLEDMALDVIEGTVDVDAAAGEAQRLARAVGGHGGRTAGQVWRDRDGQARGWLKLGPDMPGPILPHAKAGAAATAASCWWRAPWNGEPAASVSCRGLPPVELFAGFLDGRWADHGWRPADHGERTS